MIIDFSVCNYGSFAQWADLEMHPKKLSSLKARSAEEWRSALNTVSVVFGGNASGKSTLLRALSGLCGFSELNDMAHVPLYYPFGSFGSPATSDVEFAITFTNDRVAYEYRVSAASWGVREEGLISYESGRARQIFLRSQAERTAPIEFKRGSALTGRTSALVDVLRPRESFLHLAMERDHEVLAPIGRALSNGVSSLDRETERRPLHSVTNRLLIDLIGDPDSEKVLEVLLSSADVGIKGMTVHRELIPDHVLEEIRRIREALMRQEDDGATQSDAQDLLSLPSVQKSVWFEHVGPNGTSFELPLVAQSSGTLTWLEIAWPAVQALRHGGVVVVDEIDSSLHPLLVRSLVKLFNSEDTNPVGAQLICSSHDVTLLDNQPQPVLQPHQVWFCEKNDCGESELYSASEFGPKAHNNMARQYVAGNYGAIPDLHTEEMIAYIDGVESEAR